MATQIGKAHIFGLATGALSVLQSDGATPVVGYVSPNLKTLRLSHASKVDEIKGQTGETGSAIASGDSIECTFDFVPEGIMTTPGTGQTNAKASARIPAALSGVLITGLQIIACGPFADALNTDAGNTQPWVYMGGGSVSGASESEWTASLPLKRFIGITSAAALS
jgi:hypothetical protein